MSFIYNFDELYEGQSLTDGAGGVELDFGAGFEPQPVLQSGPDFNPFEGLELIQLDQSFVDAMLGRGIPLGEGSSAAFVGQPGVFATNAVPGLTSPQNDNFGFDFFIDNGGNEDLNDFIPLVVAVASAAMEYLGQFIVAADGASLEVGISLLQQGPNILASAGAAAFFLGSEVNGVQEILTGTQIELVTGQDPNGDDVDIFININTDFLTQPSAFFGTDPDRVVPAGTLDYVSILAHEILHGLGFFSFRDNSGEDAVFDLGAGPQAIESTYGLNVSFEDTGDAFLSATYDSANIQDVYGSSVQLETTFDSGGSDVSHFALFNPDGTIADTALALMNPASGRGDVAELGLLELAVLQDLFYTVNIPEDTPLVNELDGLPFTPTIATPAAVGFGGGTAGFNITLDDTSLFFTLPGSVGVEVSSLDGQSFTDRAFIGASDLGIGFAFTEEMLRAIVETDIAAVDIRLFNPAQLELSSGTNNDTVRLAFIADLDLGTAGDDTMDVNLALPSIYFGGAGNDTIRGNTGSDIFYGEDGDDTLNGRDGDDGLYGGDGNDYLGGGRGNDVLEGGSGDDVLIAGAGADIALGGEGDDVVDGGGFDDFVDGGVGNDTVSGGSGNDTVVGGDGNDTLNGDAGNDFLFGDAGDDMILGGSGDDVAFGGTGRDMIGGGDGNDSLSGEAGSDVITGGNGDDSLFGGEGNDRLLGGSGDDLLDGGSGDDDLRGGGRDDVILGGDGRDRLFGESGADTLNGGAGTDQLFGGTGDDIFQVSRRNDFDIIRDFEDGSDMLDLSDFSDAEIQAALDGATTSSSGNTSLSFDDGTVIILVDIDAADITADDILNFDGVDDMMPMV